MEKGIYVLMGEYKIENKQIQKQVDYTEWLLERKLTTFEIQLFEWAYIQGKGDYKKGKTR